MLFLNLIDRFKIVLESLKYQLLLGLYVSVKKKSKKFHLILFFRKNTARNLDGENLNFKGYEKKKWTHPRFLHRGPKKAVEQDSDVHFGLS